MSSLLTTRERLGYNLELHTQLALASIGVSFNGNPLNIELWKRDIGKGADIQTIDLEIECKNLNCKLYPAHVRSSVLPRFNNSRLRRILLINKKDRVTNEAKALLKLNSVDIWSLRDLARYYIRKAKTASIIISRIRTDSVHYSISIYRAIKLKLKELRIAEKTKKLRSLKLSLFKKSHKIASSLAVIAEKTLNKKIYSLRVWMKALISLFSS